MATMNFVEPIPMQCDKNMMTSSNGNIFRVSEHLCGEFTGDRWILRTKASAAELCFYHLRLNKRLSKQWWGWWFETPSRPLCRHCNDEQSLQHANISKLWGRYGTQDILLELNPWIRLSFHKAGNLEISVGWRFAADGVLIKPKIWLSCHSQHYIICMKISNYYVLLQTNRYLLHKHFNKMNIKMLAIPAIIVWCII